MEYKNAAVWAAMQQSHGNNIVWINSSFLWLNKLWLSGVVDSSWSGVRPLMLDVASHGVRRLPASLEHTLSSAITDRRMRVQMFLLDVHVWYIYSDTYTPHKTTCIDTLS